MTGEEYRRQLAALAEATARRDADLAATERAYHDGAAAATAELVRAEAVAGAAERRASALTVSVAAVDREAAGLWAELRGLRVRRPGWLARVGELPPPADPGDGCADPEAEARIRLDRAARRIDEARLGGRSAPPRRVLPLLPVLGAAASALTALFAAGLVTLGTGYTSAQLVMRVLGWAAFFVAPFTGLPPAAALLDRLFDSRLDIGAIGLLVLGGMVSASGISMALAY